MTPKYLTLKPANTYTNEHMKEIRTMLKAGFVLRDINIMDNCYILQFVEQEK